MLQPPLPGEGPESQETWGRVLAPSHQLCGPEQVTSPFWSSVLSCKLGITVPTHWAISSWGLRCWVRVLMWFGHIPHLWCTVSLSVQWGRCPCFSLLRASERCHRSQVWRQWCLGGPAAPATHSLLPCCRSEPLGSRLTAWPWAGAPSPHLPMSGTLPLQDEKGAFNFDQETVINPETGEQVRAASAEPRGSGGAWREWQPPP